MQLFEKRLETDSDGVNGCSAEVSKFFCVAIWFKSLVYKFNTNFIATQL